MQHPKDYIQQGAKNKTCHLLHKVFNTKRKKKGILGAKLRCNDVIRDLFVLKTCSFEEFETLK
jgi:hypothetical protein